MLSVDNMAWSFRRAKTDVRQQQIVEATLALLADSPLDQLSTRQIARALGISQPALFRHFASRDELLMAVIAATQRQLGEIAESVLSEPVGPVEKLEALARALLRHLHRHPGLPRLLFANVASGEGPLFDALKQLYSMQRALVTELTREAQRAGEIDPSIDPRDAATLFVGMLQSITLIRRLDARPDPLEAEGARLLGIWLRGVRASSSALPALPVESLPVPEGLRALDVRPILEQGTDPLDAILEALAAVGPGGVLKLTAPFRPEPLLALLGGRGHALANQRLGPREFLVEVIHGGQPVPEDLRDLPAPEPMERVLVAVSALPPSGVYLARLPRNPRLLVPHLRERGLIHQIYEEPDGSALVRVYRPR